MAGVGQLHYDEEDCLGLELFVAELELIQATRDRKPDQTQLLELLQKLQTSIGGAEPAVVKRCQKRCEGALAAVLHKGACSVVSARALRLRFVTGPAAAMAWLRDSGVARGAPVPAGAQAACGVRTRLAVRRGLWTATNTCL